MNNVILTGRLTSDAKFTASEGGMVWVSFRLAVQRVPRREGQPEADFFNCVAFGKAAENMRRFDICKGTKLLVTGQLRNRDYEKDGAKRYITEVVLSTFEFCESKRSAGGGAVKATDTAPTFTEMDDDDDDLPF